MIVVSTDACIVVIDKFNDRVIKIIKPYWLKKCPWIIDNEVRALKKLNSKHFPKYISHDENSVTMEYAGKVSTATKYIKNPNNDWDVREFEEIPADFEEQVNEILDELEKANLRHSDINFGHFLIKDGIVKLIDFELCLEYGEPEPKNYMQTMGIEAKVRNIDEPVNDRLMAKRTIEYLNDGIGKIYRLLGKLPNRLQYHELPFNLIQKTDRGYLKERVKILTNAYDFKDKKGIDLGCNIGGLTFALAIKGSKMTGVDIKEDNLTIANACENYYKLGCKFIKDDIVDYVLSNFADNKISKHYDFCLCLAVWHWIVKQTNLNMGIALLKRISKTCDTMFFEINFGHEEGLIGSEETMKDAGLTNEQEVIDFIIKHTEYKEVKNIGKCIGWNNRPTFMCSK